MKPKVLKQDLYEICVHDVHITGIGTKETVDQYCDIECSKMKRTKWLLLKKGAEFKKDENGRWTNYKKNRPFVSLPEKDKLLESKI